MPRAVRMDCLSVSLIPNNPLRIFSEALDEAARSCESAVDIVQASIPAKISPAKIARITPCSLMKKPIFISTVSDSEFFVNVSIMPFLLSVLATIPMNIAINIEMTTHTDAIRREVFILR